MGVMYFLKCIFSKVCLSKVYFCEMYQTCVSAKLCEFILIKGIELLFINLPTAEEIKMKLIGRLLFIGYNNVCS